MASPRLETDELGFRILVPGPVVDTNWDDIIEITAFKRDLFIVDLISFAIGLSDGSWLKVDEEMPGFKEFEEKLKLMLPGFDQEWWSRVAFPAFEPRATVIFKRRASGAL